MGQGHKKNRLAYHLLLLIYYYMLTLRSILFMLLPHLILATTLKLGNIIMPNLQIRY